MAKVYEICEYEVYDVDFTEILDEMVKKWNDNPTFIGDLSWEGV